MHWWVSPSWHQVDLSSIEMPSVSCALMDLMAAAWVACVIVALFTAFYDGSCTLVCWSMRWDSSDPLTPLLMSFTMMCSSIFVGLITSTSEVVMMHSLSMHPWATTPFIVALCQAVVVWSVTHGWYSLSFRLMRMRQISWHEMVWR